MSEVVSLKPLSVRRLVAIAFLDVVGYSKLMGIDEDTTLRQFSRLRHDAIDPRVRSWRGRLVNRAGDGMLIEFASAFDAIHWAIDLQDYLRSRADDLGQLTVRIALHLAEVIDYDDDDVMGDGVNVAARLQQFSTSGGIVASQTLVDAVVGKVSANFVDVGPVWLKNTRPVRAYRTRHQV